MTLEAYVVMNYEMFLIAWSLCLLGYFVGTCLRTAPMRSARRASEMLVFVFQLSVPFFAQLLWSEFLVKEVTYAGLIDWLDAHIATLAGIVVAGAAVADP